MTPSGNSIATGHRAGMGQMTHPATADAWIAATGAAPPLPSPRSDVPPAGGAAAGDYARLALLADKLQADLDDAWRAFLRAEREHRPVDLVWLEHEDALGRWQIATLACLDADPVRAAREGRRV